jgi:dTMP kinase
MSRGLFIALEGLDGSGKSTLMRQLKQNLVKYGHEIIVVEEPGGTPAGERIRQTLLDKTLQIDPVAELLLYEASRRHVVQTVIRPALETRKIVLTDRFAMSSLAYQGYGRGLSLELVAQLNAIATGGLMPDLTIFLDISAEAGLQRKRGQRDRLESAGIEFLQRVRAGYLELIAQPHQKGLRLDATQSIETLTEEAMKKIREKGDLYGILLRP